MTKTHCGHSPSEIHTSGEGTSYCAACEREARELRARELGRKLGPFGCLCQDLAHHVTGDGCEMCNPELAAEILKDNAEGDRLLGTLLHVVKGEGSDHA